MGKTSRFRYKANLIEISDVQELEKLDYDKKFGDLEDEEEFASKYFLKVSNGYGHVSSCILIGSGQFSYFSLKKLLIDGDKLIVCCGGTIFYLEFPTLELKWFFELEDGLGFAVYKSSIGYIVHGEMLITALDWAGNLKWDFGGADIFVTPEGDDTLEFDEEGVLVVDWNYSRYKIDFDGKLLWDTCDR